MIEQIAPILIMAGIFAAAGMVQGVSGFGFGLLSVALLGLVWPDPKQATILPLLPNMAICAYILWSCRKRIPWSLVWIYAIATAIGVPAGVWLLKQVSEIVIYAGLGTLLFVSAAYSLLPRHRSKPWHRVYLGVPMGLLTGGLGGAFNTGGPPAIAFFSNQRLDRIQYTAGLQSVFMVAGIVRLGSLVGADMLPARVALVSGIGIIGAIIGVAIGLALLRRTSEARIRTLIRLAQFALAAMYFARVYRLM